MPAGPAKRGGLRFQDSEDSPWREVDEVEEEHVGGLGFDVVGLEHVGREVAEVLGDDDLRAGSDGGGEDVAVVGVG